MHTAITRTELNGLYIAGRARRDRHHKITINVLPLRGQRVGFGHRDHEVRSAKLPAIAPFRLRWQIFGGSVDRAFRGPLLDETDLIDRQSPFAQKITGLRQPGWHITALRYFGHLLGVLFRVRLMDNGKWTGLAGAMAGRAIIKDNRRDLLIEAHGSFRAWRVFFLRWFRESHPDRPG